jgi:hypothetical protein
MSTRKHRSHDVKKSRTKEKNEKDDNGLKKRRILSMIAVGDVARKNLTKRQTRLLYQVAIRWTREKFQRKPQTPLPQVSC